MYSNTSAPFVPSSNNIYAVSLIIPMYNAGEYVGECLDSLLIQTFQDFEVIVVDDCSTDNSATIVESYASKFNGRLILTKTETNSGGCAVPRNVGFPLSRGEYVFFIDSDDVLTPTALEELYNLAKEHDADVVYCEKYYMSTGVGQEFKDNIHLAENLIQQPPFVDKPTLETPDLAERIKNFLNKNYWMTAWLRLVRRALLIDNNISFPAVFVSEDLIWSFKILFCAKHFLRIPNICYVRRMHENSIMSSNYTTEEEINRWIGVTIHTLQDLNDFMAGIEFFKENPRMSYDILARVVEVNFFKIAEKCNAISNFEIYNILRTKFGSYFVGDNDVLIPAICVYGIAQRRSLAWHKKKMAQKLEQHIPEQKREEPQVGTGNDFTIVYTSRPPCAVSVVIPMYNAEEYIGECLDSLLEQTFKDFEVIVVDDCSTDNSVAVVEEYAPKFNWRLMLAKTEKNSEGGGYIPRNIGLKLAKGEYVFFLDADDFIMLNALETLYNVAKENEADVVYYSSYYKISQPNDIYLYRDGAGKKLIKDGLEDKPVLIIDNVEKLLHDFLTGEKEGNFRMPWTKFVRRDFVIDNSIFFPNVNNGADFIWGIDVYCHAKRFLRIPTPLYFYRRYNTKSITQMKREPSAQIQHWFSGFAIWAKALSELANKNAVLSNNLAYCFVALKSHFEWSLFCMREARVKLSERKIYELLRKEFNEEKGFLGLMLPFLFSVIKDGKKSDETIVTIVDKFKPFVTARVDVKLIAKVGKGKFQILSISDSTATIEKPGWFQKSGVGYQIQSCVGQLKLIAKTATGGRINFGLKGPFVCDSKDPSKHLPYWIDYTKLIINDKVVFDALKPTWHDKPYFYNMNVKAGEEITVKVEWLPHRSDA